MQNPYHPLSLEHKLSDFVVYKEFIKYMKKTKVIIPALGLLLLSTAASVTGTVAWFAANKTVTAQGMSVTVKSDSTFLLIAAGQQTASTIKTGKATIVNATTATAELLPVAHDSFAADDGITEIETVAENKYTSWYYDFSNDPAVSTGSGSKTYLASDKFNNYVLVNTFSLTIADGGNDMENLKVDTCTITPSASGDQAVKVLVATGDANEEFSGTGGSGSVALQDSLDSDSVMLVKIYIYWDGADSDVYTNGIADLKSTSVVVTFTGTVA